MENYSLSDLAAITKDNDGLGGGNAWILIILFAMIFGGGIFGGNGDYGRFATAASQQEILFGQQFQNLDNKLDRLGNGIADATFALNNSIKDGDAMVAGAVVAEGRNSDRNFCELKTAVHAEGEKTRHMIQENKIDDLQKQISALELQNAMCGVVRYPMASTWSMNGNPFCGCGCGGRNI